MGTVIHEPAAHDTLQLVTAPTYHQMANLWELRLSNPCEVQYAFADVSPTFHEFLDGIERNEILCALMEDATGEIVTAAWLHDLEQDPQKIARVGWLGGYAHPNHRGQHSIMASHLLLNYFEELGVRHIHASVHIKNRPTQLFLRCKSMMGFTKVCDYANWTTFGGEPADFVIYTHQPQDRRLAWTCANKLAAKRSLTTAPL